MNKEEIIAKKNKSEEKWDNMTSSILDLLTRAGKTCDYCNLHKRIYGRLEACNHCPLQREICTSFDSVYYQMLSALKTAHKNAKALHDGIAKDIEQTKEER